MKLPEIRSELFRPLRANLNSMARSLIFGLAASLLTIPAQFALEYGHSFHPGSSFRNVGLPIAWMGVWNRPEASAFLNVRFYFYWWSFIQDWLFWAALLFSLFFVQEAIRGELRLDLLPTYVVCLSWARIQLEFQMAVAAMGTIVGFARIDPFSYAHIAAYFAMALLLFPAIITLVSRLPFREIFKLSSLGFPVILIPPFLDYYVLKQPVIYNFFTTEFYPDVGGPLRYLTILSPGIKLEIVLVATLTSAYLFYRTRSMLRSVVAIIAAVVVFGLVSTPALTSRLHLSFSQPQLFAGYLVITYLLIIVSLDLAQPGMGRTILRRTRLRGIHFPAMALFGSFLVHPSVLGSRIPEDFGLIIVSVLIVFLVWQTAVVFDDIYDGDQKASTLGYLGYGTLTATIALLAVVPFGLMPWLLVFLAVCLAMSYPRLARKHYLLSGAVIGVSSSIAFLFGTLVPLRTQSSPQAVGFIALTLFVIFSGASLLKDATNIEADRQRGTSTVFTRFKANRVLPIIAAFVAIGFVLPAIFFSDIVDPALFLITGAGVWLLIVLAKRESYKPVLVLYFAEGLYVFFRLFANKLG